MYFPGFLMSQNRHSFTVISPVNKMSGNRWNLPVIGFVTFFARALIFVSQNRLSFTVIRSVKNEHLSRREIVTSDNESGGYGRFLWCSHVDPSLGVTLVFRVTISALLQRVSVGRK